MKLDIGTLLFVTSIIFTSQTIVVFLQYKVNKTYQGLGWWLSGAILLALAFLLMPLVNIPRLRIFAVLSNPLVFSGLTLLSVGLNKFFGRKESRWVSVLILCVSIGSYMVFIVRPDGLRIRSVIVAISTAVITLKIGFTLFREKKPNFDASALFCSVIFLAYGLFQAAIAVIQLVSIRVTSYSAIHSSPALTAMFLVPIICGVLWTSGFIIMVNQRLNAANLEEQSKLQLVFDTSPGAQLITRARDSVLVDINASFLSMTGYNREEVMGKNMLELRVWNHPSDRESFLSEMGETGFIDNREYLFRRKNGKLFIGEISARMIMLQGEVHIMSVVQDISERKQAEQKIRELVQQLEFEKNLAELNAITDNLTSLMNRRYFDESLLTEFNRLKRSGASLSLIILDIDHFKNFNDTYGHLAGDNCLRQVGSVLRTVVKRLPDIVARYGGEEFVVIMPETDRDGAASLAEQIRAGVEELGIPHSTSEAAKCVTISAGVVTARPIDLEEPVQIIALADEALYEAKHNGRNQVRVSPARFIDI